MRATPKVSAATWVLLLAVSCTRSSDHVQNRLIGCHRFPNLEPAVCVLTTDGNIVVDKQSLADLSFGPEGLGSIVVDNRGLYFVTRQGKTTPALNFDNGPDYVVEGLARNVKNGKVGFINNELNQLVPPVWVFAFPFDHESVSIFPGPVSTPTFPL